LQGQTAAPGLPSIRRVKNNDQDNVAVRAGAVYVFVRSAGAWRQQACIKASNPDLGDGFGTALALSADGRTLAVGSRGKRARRPASAPMPRTPRPQAPAPSTSTEPAGGPAARAPAGRCLLLPGRTRLARPRRPAVAAGRARERR
jgi:hypothetical protein